MGHITKLEAIWGEESVEVHWEVESAPTHDYSVSWRKVTKPEPGWTVETVEPSATSYEIMGLEPETKYIISVKDNKTQKPTVSGETLSREEGPPPRPPITGTAYYVSATGKTKAEGGLGTEASPYRNVSDVRELTLKPGDGVLFKGGNTFENLIVKAIGTVGKQVVFGSYGTGGNAIFSEYIEPQTGSEYVCFDHLTAKEVQTIYPNKPSNITVQNSQLGGKKTGTGAGSYGFSIARECNYWNILYNEIKECAKSAINTVIKFTEQTPSEHWLIEGNTIENTGLSSNEYSGINLKVRHALVINNTIVKGGKTGISQSYGGCLIEGNKISGSEEGIGFFEYEENGASQLTSEWLNNEITEPSIAGLNSPAEWELTGTKYKAKENFTIKGNTITSSSKNFTTLHTTGKVNGSYTGTITNAELESTNAFKLKLGTWEGYSASNQRPANLRWGSSESPFNQKVPASPKLIGNSLTKSEEMVKYMLEGCKASESPGTFGEKAFPSRFIVGNDATKLPLKYLWGQRPMFYAATTDPLFTLEITEKYTTEKGLNKRKIRVPNIAFPGEPEHGTRENTDHHMTIVVAPNEEGIYGSGEYVDLFQVEIIREEAGGKKLGPEEKPTGEVIGGKIICSSGGCGSLLGELYSTEAGTTAPWFCTQAGLIRADELKAGKIEHAIMMDLPKEVNGGHVFPAHSNDGESKNINAVPEGQWFYLDYTVKEIKEKAEAKPSSFPPWRVTILNAMIEYGLYDGDSADGGSMGLYPEPFGTYSEVTTNGFTEIAEEGQTKITTTEHAKQWFFEMCNAGSYTESSEIDWRKLRALAPINEQ